MTTVTLDITQPTLSVEIGDPTLTFEVGVIPVGAPGLLDTLSTQPLWASWLGGKLRTGQTRVLRVRNSDDELLDVGLVGDLVDLAAIAAHCGFGDGYLVTVYNAVPNAYASITQTDPDKQAKIYDAGFPVLGPGGYLSARFDGVDDGYTRADGLGLTGDAAVTAIGDLNGDDSYIFRLGLGPHMLGLYFWPHLTPNEVELDVGDNGSLAWLDNAGTAPPGGWAQMQKPLNCGPITFAACPLRTNGVVATPEIAGDPGVALDLVDDLFEWGSAVSGGVGAQKRSNLLLFGAGSLSSGDQTACDAFQASLLVDDFLLGQISTKPRWASWLGGRLSASQTRVLRVRNSDDEELDIGLDGDLVDLAAIADHCGTGVGYLVTPYNAVDNAYVDLPAPANENQAVIYSFAPLGEVADGITHVTGPVLGANGYLAAVFDGNPTATGLTHYIRGDALGMTGDPTMTLACDMNTRNDESQYFAPMNIGTKLVHDADAALSEFNTAYIGYRDAPDDNFRFFQNVMWPAPPTSYTNTRFLLYPFKGWVQSTHIAGADVFTAPMRINGASVAITSGPGHGSLLNMVAPRFVSWGGYPAYADYQEYDTIPGISSAFTVWNANVSAVAADQALVDAWQLARHA